MCGEMSTVMYGYVELCIFVLCHKIIEFGFEVYLV
jgi:hypothetical protein